jgi:hypothetical protein
MKKIYFVLLALILVFLAFSIHQHRNPKVQESITYFPIDPKVSFKTAETTLTAMNKPDDSILWKEKSVLDRKAYLRQDAALLFANGRLIDELWNWKQNTTVIEQEKRIPMAEDVFLQAITFHHAELHENDNQIFSSQAMSFDQTFSLTSQDDEENLKKKLEQQTERMLQLSWNKGLRHFSINLSNYQDAFPLSQINQLAKDTLPGFTKTETAAIVGNLWEGLYKNYILGIKKAEGAIENPKGSTLPLILIANDKSHLLVLTETKSGEPILLRQMMEVND